MNEDRLEFLGQVAAWYYEDELDQSKIAERIGKSRSMVSRLLAEARTAGLVHVQVSFPLRTDHILEDRLSGIFGGTEVRVLAGGQVHHDSMVRSLGRLAAGTLQSRLRSDMTVAIGWGASLHAMVRAMPDIQLDRVMVLQVMGSVGDGDPNVDGADLARSLAAKLNGDFRAMAAPVIVDRPETARSLAADRTIATTLRMAESSDLAIVGIGSIESNVSGLVRAGYFNKSHIARLRHGGVVGDVLGYLLDGAGRVLDIPENNRVVALHPNKLGKIPSVIGVAGGTSKAAAINASLRAGLIDVLVTDAEAASAVIAMRESEVLLGVG